MGRGVQGLVDVFRSRECGISYVKGSASAEAFGAARYERVGPGCRRTWKSGRGLLSC